jgi:hypothetical protein
MLCILLLHGGDLDLGAWLFILLFLALAGAAVVAAFLGVIYLIGKRWPALRSGAAPLDKGKRIR